MNGERAASVSLPAGEMSVPRCGVARIVTNAGAGCYTITEQWYNPTTSCWDDATAPGYVSYSARDYLARRHGFESQRVLFWEQRRKGGELEVLIDLIGAETVLWGKAYEATPWSPGSNYLMLHPCADEQGNGTDTSTDIVAYVYTPVEHDGPVDLDVSQNDVLAYLPCGPDEAVLVNPPTTVHVQVFAVLVWRDGGTTDGSKTSACNRTYTAKTLDGCLMLGTGMTPKRRRPSAGKLSTPPADGPGVIGLGYYDVTGSFQLYDANETLATEACT